jgi:hypothetical protein
VYYSEKPDGAPLVIGRGSRFQNISWNERGHFRVCHKVCWTKRSATESWNRDIDDWLRSMARASHAENSCLAYGTVFLVGIEAARENA